MNDYEVLRTAILTADDNDARSITSALLLATAPDATESERETARGMVNSVLRRYRLNELGVAA